jgi:AbiU2
LGDKLKDRREAAVDLQHMATIADRNFQLWWALVNRIYPSFPNTLNLYSDFFGPTVDAYLRVYFVELGRLLDKRKNAISLETFFSNHSLTDPQIRVDYQNLVTNKRSQLRAIRIIRSKAIAHSDSLLNVHKVFSEAQITPNEIGDVIASLVDIVRRIIHDVDTGSGTISDTKRYEFAAMALVKHLDEWQRESPKDNRRIWTSAPF